MSLVVVSALDGVGIFDANSPDGCETFELIDACAFAANLVAALVSTYGVPAPALLQGIYMLLQDVEKVAATGAQTPADLAAIVHAERAKDQAEAEAAEAARKRGMN